MFYSSKIILNTLHLAELKNVGKSVLTQCSRCTQLRRLTNGATTTKHLYPLSVNSLLTPGSHWTSRDADTASLNHHRSLLTRAYSTNQNEPAKSELKKEPEDKPDVKLSIFQRYKKAYKEYGKILVGVHVATSVVWFGSFYYAAVSGVDVVAMLKWMGAKEGVVSAFSNPAYGNIAVAYLLYKIATPVRYTVTVAGTTWTVKQLRYRGYLPPRDKGDNIRELMKASKEKVKDTMVNQATGMKRRLEVRRKVMKGQANTTLIRMTSSARNRARSMSSTVRVRVNRMSSSLHERTDSLKKKVAEKRTKK